SRDELDPAGGAPGISAAGVELIDLGLVFQGQDQSLPRGHFNRSHSLDRELRHSCLPFQRTGHLARGSLLLANWNGVPIPLANIFRIGFGTSPRWSRQNIPGRSGPKTLRILASTGFGAWWNRSGMSCLGGCPSVVSAYTGRAGPQLRGT